MSRGKTHIPFGPEDLMCGSDSFIAQTSGTRDLCQNCLARVEAILLKHGYLVTKADHPYEPPSSRDDDLNCSRCDRPLDEHPPTNTLEVFKP